MRKQTDELTSAHEDLAGLGDAKAEHDDKLAVARGGVDRARQAVVAVPRPAEVQTSTCVTTTWQRRAACRGCGSSQRARCI